MGLIESKNYKGTPLGNSIIGKKFRTKCPVFLVHYGDGRHIVYMKSKSYNLGSPCDWSYEMKVTAPIEFTVIGLSERWDFENGSICGLNVSIQSIVDTSKVAMWNWKTKEYVNVMLEHTNDNVDRLMSLNGNVRIGLSLQPEYRFNIQMPTINNNTIKGVVQEIIVMPKEYFEELL